MERVTGIGGVFLRAKRTPTPAPCGRRSRRTRTTLARVTSRRRRHGGRNIEDSEYRKFGWATDPEGNRMELGQPPADEA